MTPPNSSLFAPSGLEPGAPTPVGRSSALMLTAAMLGLVLYASLYPFVGWAWPGKASWWQVLLLPLPRWRDGFDMAANLLGYVPLGLLACLAGVRSGWGVGRSAWGALLGAALLSWAMEVLQHFLPGRYPSALDWGLNTLGAALGVLLAWRLHAGPWLLRWQRLRDRWVIRRSAGALVLLGLWPLALLFPTPVPMALGLSWARVQEVLIDWLIDVPWAQAALELVFELPVGEAPVPGLVEATMVTLGLLGPCLLAHAVVRGAWRRMAVVPGVLLAGWAGATFSAALNFGAPHALAWVTPATPPAFVAALLLALGLAWAPQRLSAALGMVALALLLLLVAQAPADPYFDQSLQSWEQSRYVRFHGLAQWLGWLWPLAALGWLALRVAMPSQGRGRGGLPTIPPP